MLQRLLLEKGRDDVRSAAMCVTLLDEGRFVGQGAAICSSSLGGGRVVGQTLQPAMLQHSVLIWVGSLCYRRRRSCCNVLLLRDKGRDYVEVQQRAVRCWMEGGLFFELLQCAVIECRCLHAVCF